MKKLIRLNMLLVLGSICAFPAWAEDTTALAEKSQNSPNKLVWEQADKANAEAQEAKANAEKARAQNKEARARIERQIEDAIFKSQQEVEMVKLAEKKAALEARIAKHNASKSQAMLKDLKARTEMQFLESTSKAEVETKLAQTRIQKMELELRAAHIKKEYDNLEKTK